MAKVFDSIGIDIVVDKQDFFVPIDVPSCWVSHEKMDSRMRHKVLDPLFRRRTFHDTDWIQFDLHCGDLSSGHVLLVFKVVGIRFAQGVRGNMGCIGAKVDLHFVHDVVDAGSVIGDLQELLRVVLELDANLTDWGHHLFFFL